MSAAIGAGEPSLAEVEWPRHAVDFHQEKSSANSRREPWTLLHESYGIESFSFCRLPSPKAGQTAVTERTPSGHLLHTLQSYMTEPWDHSGTDWTPRAPSRDTNRMAERDARRIDRLLF